MKILIIDNASVVSVNGLHYTNNLNGLFIEELVGLGHNLTYFQFFSETTNSINSFCLEEHKVRCNLVKPHGNKILRYLSAYYYAYRAVKKADFVYLYYPSTFRFVGFICSLINKPFGLYVRGMKGVEDRTSKALYKRAYTIFTVSDYFTNSINAYLGKEKTHTIRPMIPYNDYDVVSRGYVKKHKYRILFLGRIDKEKGLVELVQAAKVLKSQGYNFVLKVVGDGHFMPELRKFIKERDVVDYIHLEGPVYDSNIKAEYYKQADIYILPTYHEGFPRTLYEAMIFGAPIITTFVGGISALMKDGYNCLQIEPRSIDSIVDKLSYAMENYDNMGIMAKNASALVSRIVDKGRPTHAYQLHEIINVYGK